MTKIPKVKIIFLLSTFYFLFSVSVYAQSIFLNSARTSYNVGDSFSVSLNIDTGGQIINTISGSISVPTDKFQIMETRYGNSIISLWVERPKIDSGSGIISFAGGVPGGFGGSNGPILSFVLKAKKTGTSALALDNIKVLLNDGLGTELKNIASKGLSLSIGEAPVKKPTPPSEKGEPKIEEIYVPSPDNIPPEDFFPMVSKNSKVADNKYFVSFFAVDKDTGVSRYEITEKPLILSYITSKFNKPWTAGESPYVLRGQWWAYKVVVRAYDQAGNYKEGIVLKPFHPVVLAIFAVLLVMITFLITRFISRPRPRHKRMI